MDEQDRHKPWTLPVPRTEVDPELILAAIEDIRCATLDQSLTITISDDPDALITVTEHEREAVTTLSLLTERIERSATTPDLDSVKQAVWRWLDSRPVPDAVAAAKGIATIGWSRALSRTCWRVVVPRTSGVSVDWVPTVHTTGASVRQIRADAMARSRQLTVTSLTTGEVTVWIYLLNPALSTAALAQPDLLVASGPIEHLYAVFTPGRPVAVADSVAAARLTEESNEPHVMLPLAELDSIGWM